VSFGGKCNTHFYVYTHNEKVTRKHRKWVSTSVKPSENFCLPTVIFRGGFCLVGRIPHPLLGVPKPLFKEKNICKKFVLRLANPYRPAVVVAKGTSPFLFRGKDQLLNVKP